eukprot:scaffold3105_cov89-Cylindrotheca_fusiformis.AAC.4
MEAPSTPESLRSQEQERGRTIDGYLFKGCHRLETVHLPPTVSTIGREAFWGCRCLRGIKLPATLESIEYPLFADCPNLEYIEIPATAKQIGRAAFYHCSSLTHIRIPPSVDTIKGDAFTGCERLMSIELPEGLPLDTLDDSEIGISMCASLMNVAIAITRTWYHDEADPSIWSVAKTNSDLCYNLCFRFHKSPLNKLCYY